MPTQLMMEKVSHRLEIFNLPSAVNLSSYFQDKQNEMTHTKHDCSVGCLRSKHGYKLYEHVITRGCAAFQQIHSKKF